MTREEQDRSIHLEEVQVARVDALTLGRIARTSFAARYGGPCGICGVVRDYHDLTPKDHRHEPRRAA